MVVLELEGSVICVICVTCAIVFGLDEAVGAVHLLLVPFA